MVINGEKRPKVGSKFYFNSKLTKTCIPFCKFLLFSFFKITGFWYHLHSIAHPGGCFVMFLVQYNAHIQSITVVLVLCMKYENKKIWNEKLIRLDFSHGKSSHHGKEVVIALDLCGHLGELLVESIGDVMSRIRGDDEDTFSDSSELYSQTTAGGMRRSKTGDTGAYTRQHQHLLPSLETVQK